MSQSGRVELLSVALAALLLPVTTAAQELEYVPELTDTEVGGAGVWTVTGTVNASANVASNRRVVGQIEGTGVTLGLALAGDVSYVGGPHEWRTSASISETFSRTPVIDQFVKSGDLAFLESIYFYHLPRADWFGPFVRFRMDTALFRGNDFRPAPVSYLVANVDGTTTALTSDTLLLTSSFSPMALKESVGAFARPYDATFLAVDVRLGVGARETWLRGEREWPH